MKANQVHHTLKDLPKLALTFDDVLLEPQFSEVMPAKVDLKTRLTRRLELNLPLISAAMDTVTEHRTAICMAQEGGIGIIHRNLSIEQQATEVDIVKRSESGMISNPITVNRTATVGEVQAVMREYRISGLPVTCNKELVGIVTNRDIRFETNPLRPINELMTQGRENLVTVKKGIDLEDSKAILHRHRIEKLLVVNDDYELVGLITIKDIEKSTRYPLSSKDEYGRLLVGAAVGVGKSDIERAEALVAASVDVLVVDTAHANSAVVLKAVAEFCDKFKDVEVIAGNIVTADAALALIERGCAAVKVGIGPGSICTTRVVAGVGMPQITAIANVVSVARQHDVPVISDGGIKYSGDIIKALAIGADTVMIGNLFAGTEESPGQTVLYQGRRYKIYRGMGSMRAMRSGSAERYFQDSDSSKHIPEGIEGRVPFRGSLSESIFQYQGGIKAGMGYVGCANIPELHQKARFVRVSNMGLREGHIHDVQITEEAPNYHRSEG